MAKGQKTCPACNTQTGPRAATCPNCNAAFPVKTKRLSPEKKAKLEAKRKRREERKQKENKFAGLTWADLLPADIIEVKKGPYFKNSLGEEVDMGYSGRFTVVGQRTNGLLTYGEGWGYCFIYFGPNGYNPQTGMYNRPHKLRIIKHGDINRDE